MSEQFMLNNRKFANLDWESIDGSSGLGVYRLFSRIRITTDSTKGEDPIMLSDLSGVLRVTGKNKQNQHIGRLIPMELNMPIKTYDYIFHHQIILEIELDSRRLAALEEIRKGGDLDFTLSVSALVYSVANKELEKVVAELKFHANQSTWITILANMGYRKTLLVEVPIVDETISPDLADAAKHLQQAQEQMLYGKNREAVGACRDVVDSLSSGLKDDRGRAPEEIEAWFKSQRDMSKEQRLQLVRRAVKVLTHPARHADEAAAKIEWGPHDARAAIAMTAALLQVADRNLKQHA